MSCTLYLVRHAIAEDAAPSGRDADRRLTAEGIAKMERAALGLREFGATVDAVLASPLVRAHHTAELLCAALAPGLRPTIYRPLAPGGVSSATLAGLGAFAGKSALALVGHEPDLGELAAHLVAGRPVPGTVVFKKGGVAAFEVEALPPRRGTLHWLLTPKQLRALAP